MYVHDTALNAPDIDGQTWKVDRPFKHNRYVWTDGETAYVIRDVGFASLWRLHARNLKTGDEVVYARDDRGNNQDGLHGLRTLFAAAFRRHVGRSRENDTWIPVAFPSLHDYLFEGISA